MQGWRSLIQRLLAWFQSEYDEHVKSWEEDNQKDFLGGFQLEFVSISQVINHNTCYKFEWSHWWKESLLKKSFTRFALQSKFQIEK